MPTGSARKNLGSEFNIIIEFGGVVFNQNDIQEFVFNNEINKPPNGYFSFVDINSNFFRMEVGIFGTMIFSNTNDTGKGIKASGINFILDELIYEGIVAGNTIYGVKWTAGNAEQLKKKTRAFVGSSVEGMVDVFKDADVNYQDLLTFNSIQLDDDMVWKHINENMWERLDTIVQKSFRKNDYIFWVWNDVDNAFKISSYALENSTSDARTQYMFVQSDDAVASTSGAKAFLQSPEFTIWSYSESSNLINLGLKRKELFPNISYSIPVDNKLIAGEVNSVTFSQMLKEMGDTKYDEILKYTQLSRKVNNVEMPFTFGDLKVRRLNRNNMEGHKSYEFADVYRDYKQATYAKQTVLRIYNNIGPPIGSKVTYLKMGNGYKVNGLQLDTHFSDTYIVSSKTIKYNVNNDVSYGGPMKGSTNIETTIKLISDNFIIPEVNEDNIANWHITKIIESMIDKSGRK